MKSANVGAGQRTLGHVGGWRHPPSLELRRGIGNGGPGPIFFRLTMLFLAILLQALVAEPNIKPKKGQGMAQ